MEIGKSIIDFFFKKVDTNSTDSNISLHTENSITHYTEYMITGGDLMLQIAPLLVSIFVFLKATSKCEKGDAEKCARAGGILLFFKTLVLSYVLINILYIVTLNIFLTLFISSIILYFVINK